MLCSNLVYKLPEDLIPKKTDDIGKNPYDDQLVLAYLNPKLKELDITKLE